MKTIGDFAILLEDESFSAFTNDMHTGWVAAGMFFFTMKEDNPEELKQLLLKQLDVETVTVLAQNIRAVILEHMNYIDGEELYERMHTEGHAFIRWMWEKMKECGVEVSLAEIDSPITPSDVI